MSILCKEGVEWAQLVCTTDLDAPTLPICGEKVTIGRAQGCNLSLPENKLISGQHCVLTRNEDGLVLLKDTSTNGTLISTSSRKVRVTKGNIQRLQHGDEIFLVFKKDDPTKNVAYMFQDLSQLLDETQVNDDPESDEECTQEYDVKMTASTPTKRAVCEVDSSAEIEEEQAKKPKIDITSQEEQLDQPSQPREQPRVDLSLADSLPQTSDSTGVDVTSEGVADTDSAKQQAVAPTGTETANETPVITPSANDKTTDSSVAAVDSPAGVTPEGGDVQGSAGEAMADNLICSICQDIFHDCISLQPCLHSFCAACYSSWMDLSKECPSCRVKVERISRNFIVNGLVEAFVKEHPDRKRSDDEKAEMDAKNKITRDMMVLSKKRRVRDYDDGYSEEDEDDEDYDDDEDYNDDGGRNHGEIVFNIMPPLGGMFGIGAPQVNLFPGRPASICIQCPGYLGPGPNAGITIHPPLPTTSATSTTATVSSTSTATSGEASTSAVASTSTSAQPAAAASTSTSAQPAASASTSTSAQPAASASTSTSAQPGASASTSTSAQPGASASTSTSAQPQPLTRNCRGYKQTSTAEMVPMPEVPQFVCPDGGNHLMCGCCRRQMPDRRQEFFANPQSLPSQKCDVCGNFFCHMYWGCNRIDCNGCLNKFQDLHFGKKCLDSLILKNSYESEILKDYLQRKNLTWKDVLASCMTKLDAGEYICLDGAINRISSANILCYHCGLRNFQELAYQYRRDIPRIDLPLQIVSRPDCHWGNKCRTQISKLHHAKNFNHICEQTRF
ncbi:E3 ubiquitin-protein ligase CHFR-like [Acanthaster planci]|uniref:E3 ubiquitin-protein ligase CHFR n=1 Tax=Acanthaster planci TaxID=133434 RepID=A0A8B7ZBD5_ACAPL|nr:E3 ubiquitin-protein ligase CHFR-like [Acanthaster planci]